METLSDEESEYSLKFCHLEDVFEKSKLIINKPGKGVIVPQTNEEEQKLVDSMLFGGVDITEIPYIKSKTVKLYVTSGLPDHDFERNVFMEHVYPSIRQYCRDRHGIDFQAVDLRWGMENVPDLFKPSTDICLKELRRCQEKSMGPSFLCLMGQKYCSFLPPQQIEKDEFETLLLYLAGNGREDEAILVDKAYKEDTNSAPTMYRLQWPTAGDEEARKTWSNDMRIIHSILQLAADACFEKGSLGSEACTQYRSSHLEKEIEVGVLELNDTEKRENCILFSRTFIDTKEIRNSKHCSSYLDDEDQENNVMLKQLQTIVSEKIGKQNVTSSDVLSSQDLHIESVYAQKLTKSLFYTVKTSVDSFMESRNAVIGSPLNHEIYRHWDIVRRSSPVYLLRDDLLSSVKQYLLMDSDQPLVIHGGRGSGKTATIAKIVNDVNIAIQNNDLNMRTAIVFRFIGQTQNSRTAQQLLYYLCQQLCHVMGKCIEEVPSEYKALKLFFLDLVQRGEFGGMLIILLDSLECISTCDNGHKLEWIPSRIAQNVKIVLTVDNESTEMVQRLRHKCEDNMTRISPLVFLECTNIMKVLMNTSKMSVTYNQWNTIKDVLQITREPLFIKLTLNEVIRWRSYDSPERTVLGKTIDEAVERVFNGLEKNHGSILVSHVLGYLAASNDGFSESELLDLLSLDEIILNNIFTSFHPPVRRFPPALLIQIRQEIDLYMEERESDGILVLQWKYGDFDRIAKRRYLRDEKLKRYLHSNIADYYLGLWSGTTQKPYVDNDGVSGMKCRFVPEQSTVFRTCDVDEKYNLRKMNQLPPSLLYSCRFAELKSQVFCNYNFLYNRIKATSLQVLLTDFDLFNDRECKLVSEALRMSGSAITIDLRSLVIELIGRLLPLTEDNPAIRNLVHQCDLNIQKNCPLVPNVQCYSAPGGPLQCECDVGGTKYCPVDIGLLKSPDGILLTAKPFYSRRVRVWELSRGDPRPDMMMPVGQIHHSRNGNFLCVFEENKTVKIFRSDCGEQHGDVQYGYGVPSHVEISNKYVSFTIEKGCGPYIIELEKCSILHKFGYHSQTVAISPNDTHIACNSGPSVILFELPLMERRCVAEVSDVPKKLIFLSHQLRCYVLTRSKSIETILFDTVNRKNKVKRILTDLEIRECLLSNTEKYVLVRSGRCLHVINSKTEKLHNKLTDLPSGVYVDPITTYTGAGFSVNDDLIVASRSNFVAIWDTLTGSPLRILQSSAISIIQMFTSDVVNKVVCLLEGSTVQVWNLDNIDTNILHSNNIFTDSVTKVASATGKRVAAISDSSTEAKIISMSHGMVTDILQYSSETDNKLHDVMISHDGRFVITSAKPADGSIVDGVCPLFREFVIWDVDNGSRVYQTSNSSYAAITKRSNKSVFVKCVQYDPSSWSENIYNIIAVNMILGSTVHCDFPQRTEFVSSPKLLTQNTIDYLVCIIQTSKKTFDHETQEELASWTEIRLLIQNISSSENAANFVRIQNLIDGADIKSQFLEVFPTPEEKLLILYGREIDEFSFDSTKGTIRPSNVSKGAIIFDAEREECLRHIPGVLRPDSCIDSLLLSSKASVFLDSDLHLFFGESFRNVAFIDTEFSPGNFRLALDGKYIVGLLANKREIVVVRGSDGSHLGRVFVHGQASCLEVDSDDRTVIVGCEDGRVIIFTLVLDLSDPVTEIIVKLPSRNACGEFSKDNNRTRKLIKEDMRQMECRTPDLVRMSARRRSLSSSGRRTPDHQTISHVVSLTRKNSLTMSEACCLQ